jgi:50S ribosomal protein L16 3-hydroxylase
VLLFVDGETFECTGAAATLAEQLSGEAAFVIDPAIARSDAALALLLALFNQGSVTFDDEE